MTVSLEDLLVTTTKDEAVESMIATMQSLGLPTTAWQSGSIPRTIIETIAQLYSDALEAVSAIAAGGYLDLAVGDWLSLLSESLFDITRDPATKAIIDATLTAASGSGPHVISIGQLFISDASGNRFVNTTGGTLSAGPVTLDLVWEAEIVGTTHNVADNDVNVMVTVLAGVTVNNPGPDSLTTSAVDEQTDAELRIECQARWATLAVQSPADAYVAWALEASDEVTRVYVDDQNPDGPGTVRVYLAGASGPATAGAITEVDDFIQPRRAISSQITTLAAVQLSVPITVTVYATAATAPSIATVTAVINAYFQSLAIGGVVIPALAPLRLFTDQIEQVILALPGVLNVTLVAPAANQAMVNNEVAVPIDFQVAVAEV